MSDKKEEIVDAIVPATEKTATGPSKLFRELKETDKPADGI